jgi:glycosyltransferase involved in cell wall biosynthesis
MISIIIPTWNHAEALAHCLASLEEQDEKDLEVIVVDDASTDKTEAVLRQHRASYPFHTVRLPENRGAAVARNEGARMATGRYFLFLDADVELRPDALTKMRQALEADPEAAFVYASFRFGWKRFKGQLFSLTALKKKPFIHTTSLLRRTVFPGFDERLKKFQDWDLWLTIAERGGKGVWIPEELFTVAAREEGMSHWLPSIVHRLPWPIAGWMPREVAAYRYWEGIVKQKHGIT